MLWGEEERGENGCVKICSSSGGAEVEGHISASSETTNCENISLSTIFFITLQLWMPAGVLFTLSWSQLYNNLFDVQFINSKPHTVNL